MSDLPEPGAVYRFGQCDYAILVALAACVRLSPAFRATGLHAGPVVSRCTGRICHAESTAAAIAFFVVFSRYAYAALESSAQGMADPPAVTVELVTGSMSLPFKQLLVFLLMGSALVAAKTLLGAAAVALLACLMYLWLPASVMELATSHSLMCAINPLRLTSAIRAIGWPYALLWFFLLLLSCGNTALQSLLWKGEGTTLVWFGYSLLSMYFMLAMFHLMGYVIFQYHEPLGYPVEQAFSRPPAEPGARSVMNQVAMLLQEGQTAEAKRVLKQKIAFERGDLGLRRQYHKLLLLSEDRDELARHAQGYLTVLLSARSERAAAEVARDSLNLVPDFRPALPEQVYPLMLQLKEMRESAHAVRLARNFHQRHPAHADLPAIYFLAAKMLCEDLRQDAQALKILDFLLLKFPQHALNSEIRQYQSLLGQLSSQV